MEIPSDAGVAAVHRYPVNADTAYADRRMARNTPDCSKAQVME